MPISKEKFSNLITEISGRNDLLELRHDYIQWLFPNYFRSMFNPDSCPLTTEEAKLFRNCRELAMLQIQAYKLMYAFFGLLLDTQTGAVSRADDYEIRMNATLVPDGHNRLRIWRILTNMHNVGFASFAFQLVDFLTVAASELDFRSQEPFTSRLATYGRYASREQRLQNYCLVEEETDLETSVVLKGEYERGMIR
eukprot:TRINITY_DN5000_c0_g1_i3.p1 TRINITY_DN5000_c0_g1~~TRINITY_DN5000_c0_g1_i3.p1  ORF type:complete len:196 (-),score=22.85 TRINITY_DN5000_c0_g1_i3:9-596(-)